MNHKSSSTTPRQNTLCRNNIKLEFISSSRKKEKQEKEKKKNHVAADPSVPIDSTKSGGKNYLNQT